MIDGEISKNRTINFLLKISNTFGKNQWKYKLFFILIFLSIPFSAINFTAYFSSNMPTNFQVTMSLLFLGLLFIIGWIRSSQIKEYFIYSTIYWLFGFLFLLVAYSLEQLTFFSLVLLILYPGPSYGLRYFLELPADQYLVLLCIIISYGSGIIGSLIGRFLSLIKSFSK